MASGREVRFEALEAVVTGVVARGAVVPGSFGSTQSAESEHSSHHSLASIQGGQCTNHGKLCCSVGYSPSGKQLVNHSTALQAACDDLHVGAGKRAATAKQLTARKQQERKRLVGNLTAMVQEMRKVCLHPQLSKYWSSLSEGLSLNKVHTCNDQKPACGLTANTRQYPLPIMPCGTAVGVSVLAASAVSP